MNGYEVVSYQPPRAFVSDTCVGLAESGQRREKGPPSGRIKVGLDSYVDPDKHQSGQIRCGRQGNYTARLKIMFSEEHVILGAGQVPATPLCCFGFVREMRLPH